MHASYISTVDTAGFKNVWDTNRWAKKMVNHKTKSAVSMLMHLNHPSTVMRPGISMLWSLSLAPYGPTIKSQAHPACVFPSTTRQRLARPALSVFWRLSLGLTTDNSNICAATMSVHLNHGPLRRKKLSEEQDPEKEKRSACKTEYGCVVQVERLRVN